MSQKHVLIGNGININFGGRDYTNGQIIERLSVKLKQNDGYFDDVFAGIVSSEELLGIIEGLNDIFNKMLNGSIFSLRRAVDEEEMRTLVDISRRYKMKTYSAVEIGMEDYFYALKWFNNGYPDGEELTKSAFQGLKQLFLDSIFNNGEIEELYLKMQPFSRELEQFDTVFTVNYDTNLKKLNKIINISDEQIMKVVEWVVLSLNKLNEKTEYAIIETDARESIYEIIQSAAIEAGLKNYDEDITVEWREW